jgi:hypothetical protein
MESKEVKGKGKNKEVEKNKTKKQAKKFQRYKQGEIMY